MKSDTKDHVLYDSIYMKSPEQANPEKQKDQWLAGARERGQWEETANGHGPSFMGNDNGWKDIVVIVVRLCENTQLQEKKKDCEAF